MAANRNRNNSASTATATRPRTARRMAAPSRPVKVEAPAKSGSTGQITHDMIAARAYDLWKIRGGDAELNWLEAEQLLRNGM